MINNYIHVGPSFKLPLPVGYSGQRRYDKKWSSNTILMHGMDKRQWLNCFPQSHLICQYAILPEINAYKIR